MLVFTCEPNNCHVDNCLGVGLLSCNFYHSKLLSTSVLYLIEAFKQDQGFVLESVFIVLLLIISLL